MSKHQAMSFEHATDRFYTFDLYIFSLLLTGCSIFSTVQKFCLVQVTRSSSFVCSYVLLMYMYSMNTYTQCMCIHLSEYFTYTNKFFWQLTKGGRITEDALYIVDFSTED